MRRSTSYRRWRPSGTAATAARPDEYCIMTTNGADNRARLEADVGARRVARVYAEALFDEASARNQAREVLDELQALVNDVVRANPDAAAFFHSAAIGREHKAEALRSALQGRASELLLNFVLVLN